VDLALQPYDFVMLAVLLISTVFGAWKGMAWQLATLASLVVSLGVAVHASGPIAPYLSIREPWNRCVAIVVLYLLTALVIWLVFRVVAKIIDRVQLKEFDRQVGALFGAAKGVLWCLVITFFAVTLSETARQAVLRSRSGYYTALLIQRARPVMPQDLRALLGKYIEELDRKLDPDNPPIPPNRMVAGDAAPVAPQEPAAAGSPEAAERPEPPAPEDEPTADAPPQVTAGRDRSGPADSPGGPLR
jgi:membrane protein required for colicin V production